MTKVLITIFNCFLLYVGWYGAVILAAYDYPVLAPSILLPIILWEIFIGKEPYKRFIVVVAMMTLGFFIETFFLNINLVNYASPLSLVSGSAPLWILGLWGIFGATLDDVIQWFEGKNIWLLAAIGGIGAAFSYFGASLVGAISFPRGPFIALSVIGILWAILLPLFFKVRKLF